MRIKVKLGDVEKEILITPKKKHQNQYLDKIEELQKIEGEDDPAKGIKASRDFIKFQDDLVVECSTITKEEFDELDLEEQGKLAKALRSIVFPFAGGDPAAFF